MPDVDWTIQAIDDLQELPPEVAQAILEVGRVSLHARDRLLDTDPDEGYGSSRNGTSLCWRRGLTRDDRIRLTELEKELSSQEPPQLGDADDSPQPWDYVLLYRERSLREVIRHKGRGLVVLRILHARHIAFFLPQEASRLRTPTA